MVEKKTNFNIQIESAGPWSEKDRELFIKLLAEALAQYLSSPENCEALRGQIDGNSPEKHE